MDIVLDDSPRLHVVRPIHLGNCYQARLQIRVLQLRLQKVRRLWDEEQDVQDVQSHHHSQIEHVVELVLKDPKVVRGYHRHHAVYSEEEHPEIQ